VVTELKWYDPKDDHHPWIQALAEVRQRAMRHIAQWPPIQL
jgi:hypothetical protein